MFWQSYINLSAINLPGLSFVWYSITNNSQNQEVIIMNPVCYIVSAGEYSPLNFCAREEDMVIAVDGGYDYLAREGKTADLLIGDLDSISKIPHDLPVIKLNPMKDDTDTLAAVKLGLERGYKRFRILCGTGGSFAHTFANIQTLLYVAKMGFSAELVNKSEIYTAVHNNTLVLPAYSQGVFSVFSLSSKSEGVTLRHVKYKLDNVVLSNDFPIGINNEFVGESPVVEVINGDLLVIYPSHPVK